MQNSSMPICTPSLRNMDERVHFEAKFWGFVFAMNPVTLTYGLGLLIKWPQNLTQCKTHHRQETYQDKPKDVKGMVKVLCLTYQPTDQK